MTGLNDNFLLADDSMEPKETPAIVVNAFKDAPGADGEPELRDDIDLIAAATEELSIQLRDLDLLRQSIQAQGGMSQSIALEAQAIIPGFLTDDRPVSFFTKHPSRTMLSVALEDIENEKKGALARIWDAFIAFLKKVYQFITKIATGIDLKAEEELAEKARKIAENKLTVDFVNDVVKLVPKKNLAIIAAIETDSSFMNTYVSAVNLDRDIYAPSRIMDKKEIAKGVAQATDLDKLTNRCQASIIQAMNQDEEDCERPLRQALGAGTSINGTEHGAYIKRFAETCDNRQRFEDLQHAAESYKRSYGPEEEVRGMQKIAAALSNQFTLELHVVQSFMKLNRALIEVNDKIHQGT